MAISIGECPVGSIYLCKNGGIYQKVNPRYHIQVVWSDTRGGWVAKGDPAEPSNSTEQVELAKEPVKT